MLHAATLNNMTTNRTPRPTPGRRIAARRKLLNLSGPDVERITNGVIYQKLLSRLETGRKAVSSLTLTEVDALIRALQWTYDEFAKETGVANFAPQPVPGSSAHEAVHVPHWGAVSAGVHAQHEGGTVTHTTPIHATRLGFKPSDLENVGTLTVEGQVMLTPRAASSVEAGSVLVVEWGAFPFGDDLVVGWVPEFDMAALKRNDEARDARLSDGDRSISLESVVFEPRGVVRWVMRKP